MSHFNIQFQLNKLAEDMHRFVEEHPDTFEIEKVDLDTCIQCRGRLKDPQYAPYLLCSSRCDERAENAIDGEQQDV